MPSQISQARISLSSGQLTNIDGRAILILYILIHILWGKDTIMSKFVIRTVPSGIKFDLKATNGQVIAVSEGYTAKASCINGIESVKKNAAVAEIVEEG